MKKIFAVLLAFLMLVPLFTMQSFALGEDVWSDFEKDGIYYILIDEEEAYVMSYEGQEEESEPEEIVIPETVKHKRKTYTVTGVMDEAFVESHFSKITLPATIEYIGSNAFWGSAMLEEVVIPETCEIVYFGVDVFTGTPAEGKFFEKDINLIGKNVLYSYMSAEKEFAIPDYITILAPGCFMFSGIENVTFNDNITEIPQCAFYGCRNLKEIEIPDGVTYLYDSAFKDCINLEKVTLGADVEFISLACFAGTKIETIHLGAAVQSVAGAFYGCNNLKNITVDEDNEQLYTDDNALYYFYEYDFPEDFDVDFSGKDVTLEYYFGANTEESYTVESDVTYIGDYAFYNCRTLKSIDLSNAGLVGTKAFAYSTIEEVVIGNCDFIGESAFSGCKNLEKIDLSSVSTVDTAAFENCTNLKSVTLGDYVSYIGGLAFSNTAIEKIEIYGDYAYVGEDSFKSCKELKEVTFGDGVWHIGSNVLRYCDNVETVYISKTVDFFDENVFQNCEDVKFQVIKGSDGYKLIKSLGYDFEVVGKLTFFESISAFFESIFEFFFGWLIGM